MKLARIGRINKQLVDQVRNNLRLSVETNLKSINKDVIYKKVNEANSWYTRIIGLDEVKQCQNRVEALQERLLNAQEKRREIGQELTEVRRKSNELQEQIHKVKRQEDLQRFLDLMKAETEVLKQEQDASRRFSECDREEREIFTAFTNAVRDSHEKQRSQLEYTKYFGLVLTIAGSFLTFVYAALRREGLKSFIKEHMDKNGVGVVMAELQQNNVNLNSLVGDLRKENERLVKLISNNYEELKESLKTSGPATIQLVSSEQFEELYKRISPEGATYTISTSYQPQKQEILIGAALTSIFCYAILRSIF